jgi:hypothetical protein
LRVILETLGGTKSVKEACAELGMGEARFHELRTVVLAGAVENLELGAAGRPRREEPAVERRVRELEAEIRALKFQLHAANVREELAIAMPHLLRPRKKGDQKKRRSRSSRIDRRPIRPGWGSDAGYPACAAP